jgi:hypothetical protein
MDILNFISWIKGRRQVTSVNPNRTLLPVGLKDDRRDDSYLAGAISVQDFTTQVATAIPAGQQGPIGPQGVPGPVGPAGLTWQGAWVSGDTYAVDDAVGYDGASWFCINPTSGTTAPDLDPTNWALLAAEGATGPQGPQGIAGPAGPSGSGTPGTIYGQTTFWNSFTAQWQPNFGIATNPGTGAMGTARIGIGTPTLNTTGYPLRMFTNNAGIRIDQITNGVGIPNRLQTPQAQFDYGLNGTSADPLFNNSMYFTMFQAFPIKFATGFAVGGGDRLIIQANGQVTIGATQATNPVANLVVKQKDIEVEDFGRGLILASPSGTRYRISVSDAGVVTSTLA